MFVKIGSYEAKTKLPEILRRVEAGEAFTITNRGKPIADLIPSRARSRVKAELAINNLLKMKAHIVSDSDLKSMLSEGRK